MILERIFLSAGHAFFGRHGRPPAAHPMQEVSEVECVSGAGLRGDRFFEYKSNYRGQVTLFSADVWDQLQAELPQVLATGPEATRRNLIVRGVDLNTLIGQTFELQGVELEGVEECRPCYWMDQAIAPGAEAWLRGRGGLRCRVLSDGWLRSELAVVPAQPTR
ncbi:MAG TPA: MOSC domain-containing protein [Candidatus Synoicihabitans sp.]|nr:MOSC domain-containing protein [Candidatus Synoicihabitans sp.]